MVTLIITDGIFNNYDILDEISFEGKILVYDKRFGKSPALRNPLDRNKIEEYFDNNDSVDVDLISFNHNDEIITKVTEIYLLITKAENEVNMEFLNYIRSLTKIKPKIIFSVRKSFYNTVQKRKTCQSLCKEMGLKNNHENINTNVRKRLSKIKKRAKSSSKKTLKKISLEGSPFA